MDFPRRPAGRRPLAGAWNTNPFHVDGYQAGGVPWPMETTRYAYVTPLGGFSDDLATGRIGLNRQALRENTELMAGDEVTVSVFERGRPVPLIARPTFELVSLDFATPDAFVRSAEGEAVLSYQDVDARYPGLEELDDGVQIVLNGVFAARRRVSS